MLTTLCFVINKKNVREYDREYCFFTKKYGKINLIAKSVRKPLSKLSAQLEPPALIEIVFTPSGEKGLTTTALAKKSYFIIRKNIDKLKAYHRITKTINQLTITKQPDRALWDLLSNTIKYLNSYDHKLVELNFLAKFLKVLGLSPNLKYCINCQSKIIDSQAVFFDRARGGFVCHKCRPPLEKTLTNQLFRTINALNELSLDEITKRELNMLIVTKYKDIKKFFNNYIKQIEKYF